MDLLDTLSRSTRTADAAEGRLYGALAGKVTTVETTATPKGLQRVKARLSGMQDGDETGWLMPLFFGGVEGRARVGDPVVAWFIDGDPNRGVFATTAISTQNGRPTEHMVLGDALLPLLNYLVDEINTVKGAYNQLQASYAALVSAYDAHKHTAAGSPTSVPDTIATDGTSQVSITDAGFFQRADGSTPDGNRASVRVLSADQVVR